MDIKKYQQFQEGMAAIEAQHEADLIRRGAIDMQAESNFIGYIRLEPDGRFSNEIHSWGVNRGKLFYGDTIDGVEEAAFRALG